MLDDVACDAYSWIVLIRRGERYRIYPTPEQITRLAQWDGALRWLWNNAHAERTAKLAAGYVQPTAFDQINDLTALRASTPWLADVPRNVCAQLLVELDKAWQWFFLKLADVPRHKRRSRGDRAPVIEPSVLCFRVEDKGRRGVIVFPKLGALLAVVHRPVSGKAKTCAIVRDGDQWFACISCEQEIADPIPSTKPAIALDVGIAKLVADSRGGFVENPKHAEKMQPRIRRAQRTVARRQKGSKNQQKAKARVARLQRKVRRQREHALHTASARFAKSHGVIIVEDLKIANMTASAAGTVESPGTNVAQKSGLNRSILGAGWGKFRTMLEYKVIPEGGVVLRRPAAYSSQECSECHRIDPASRPTQSLFLCTGCGYTANADTNAARTMLSRWERETAVETTVAVCGGTAARERPAKQKLHVVRRGPRTVEAAHG
jgi:putative transposase